MVFDQGFHAGITWRMKIVFSLRSVVVGTNGDLSRCVMIEFVILKLESDIK